MENPIKPVGKLNGLSSSCAKLGNRNSVKEEHVFQQQQQRATEGKATADQGVALWSRRRRGKRRRRRDAALLKNNEAIGASKWRRRSGSVVAFNLRPLVPFLFPSFSSFILFFYFFVCVSLFLSLSLSFVSLLFFFIRRRFTMPDAGRRDASIIHRQSASRDRRPNPMS